MTVCIFHVNLRYHRVVSEKLEHSIYRVSHQLCSIGTSLESALNMLRFEKFFDFWKIQTNSTGWVKKVLKNSRKRKFFSNVQKIIQNPLLTFFGIWLSDGFDMKTLNEAKKNFFLPHWGFWHHWLRFQKKSRVDSGKFFGL